MIRDDGNAENGADDKNAFSTGGSSSSDERVFRVIIGIDDAKCGSFDSFMKNKSFRMGKTYYLNI